MTRRLLPFAISGLAACWRGAPAPPGPSHAAARSPSAADPRTFGDDAAFAAIDRHAWIRELGHAWIRGEDPLDGARENDAIQDPVAVVGRKPTAVRVVGTSDGARVAVWIAATDLRAVTIEDGAFAESSLSKIDPMHRVAVAPGVPLAVEPGPPQDGKLKYRIDDGVIDAAGWLDPRAVDVVWQGPSPSPTPRSPAALHVIAGTRVFREPDGKVIIATAKEEVSATASDAPPMNHMREIEIAERGITVRGFVAESALAPDAIERGKMAFGSAYGITDTDRLVVAAGACLYDREDGEVIGVNLDAKERYARGVESAWPAVYVGTWWAIAVVYVHSVGGTLDSCGRRISDP